MRGLTAAAVVAVLALFAAPAFAGDAPKPEHETIVQGLPGTAPGADAMTAAAAADAAVASDTAALAAGSPRPPAPKPEPKPGEPEPAS
jgi:hypothetical protein